MSYRMDLTDQDTSTLQSEYLRVTPMHLAVVSVAPPANRTDLVSALFEDPPGMGGYLLSRGGLGTAIDQQLHEDLLEQSLEEYGHIWRSLAQR